jgi:hypothetical protein
MEPDRFDDVELRVIEEPVPARSPRRGTRWALAIVAGVLSAATLAAGASALTSAPPEPIDTPAAQQLLQPAAHTTWGDGGTPCPGMAHPKPATAPRY